MEKLKAGAERLGLPLGDRELGIFQDYYEELIAWNQRMNLTAITGYEQVQVNHFLDALTVALVWKPGDENASRVLDVGAGAGIPGLPLKIVFNTIHLTLLEATGKKTQFLNHLTQKLELDTVEVVTGRAEELAHRPGYREGFGLVLARGLAPLATLVELTLPFCARGGILIAYKKGDIQDEIEQGKKAIFVLGGELIEVKPVNLPEFSDRRCLVVIKKAGATPAQYPRRSGIPAKRPIK